MLMPFHVLRMWLRALLAPAFIALGVYLLFLWRDEADRRIVVERPREVRPQEGQPEPPRDEPRRAARVEPWQFGLNWGTAYLLGGLGLLAYSLGGFLVGPGVLRRRGADEPRPLRSGDVRRIRRPDGTELHVELYGPPDGPPVVLTHGWGLDGDEWYYAKKRLGERHRLIVWDLPGLGQSDAARDGDYSVERLARDLEAVLALAGGRPAVLVGHSIGGMILLTFCRLFPEALGPRVRGLVIAQSTYTNPVRTTKRAGLYTALQKPVLEPLCHLMIWLSPVVWVLNWLSYLNGSAHRSTERDSFTGWETPGQLNFLTVRYVRAWPAVLARGMLGMFRYDATATLPTIPVPVLLVAGKQDTTCKPEASAFMSQTIPGAQLVAIDPAKHCGVFEHHEQFNEQVGRFVASCPGATEPAGLQRTGSV